LRVDPFHRAPQPQFHQLQHPPGLQQFAHDAVGLGQVALEEEHERRREEVEALRRDLLV
jgi:hypothetical protein